ncbi:hypothetical protein PEB0150_004970 [Bartonella apis]|nr:hypothetical protein PEB0150_004970 [Bartonella apis]
MVCNHEKFYGYNLFVQANLLCGKIAWNSAYMPFSHSGFSKSKALLQLNWNLKTT